jgi:hypothetical protein
VFAAQAVQLIALAVALYSPAAQSVQTRLAKADPAVLTYFPAAQVVHAAQLAWFSPVAYVLASQAVHVRFKVADGSLLTCVPAAQVVHAVQVVRLGSKLYVPDAQAAHTRLAVADPALVMYVPAIHIVLATQMVAGLPSLSQVLSEHASAGLDPPAQYWPATQASQTVLVVAVAAAV